MATRVFPEDTAENLSIFVNKNPITNQTIIINNLILNLSGNWTC